MLRAENSQPRLPEIQCTVTWIASVRHVKLHHTIPKLIDSKKWAAAEESIAELEQLRRNDERVQRWKNEVVTGRTVQKLLIDVSGAIKRRDWPRAEAGLDKLASLSPENERAVELRNELEERVKEDRLAKAPRKPPPVRAQSVRVQSGEWSVRHDHNADKDSASPGTLRLSNNFLSYTGCDDVPSVPIMVRHYLSSNLE